METRWLYTTSENFPALREASKEVCVIPMGCVEKHGLHLPLGTDIIRASTITYEASKLETFCVFPDFTFGDVPENYPTMPAGSITLPVDTEMLLLEQLCEQIARNGFKKIMIVNCHGGNSFWLKTFLRRMENKPHDYVLVISSSHTAVPHQIAEDILENGAERYPELTKEDVDLILKYHEQDMKLGHGCFNETAQVMAVAPESVHLDRLGIEDGQDRKVAAKYKENGITIRDGGWFANYPNAFTGDDPVGCNERIGKAALRYSAERLAKIVKFYKEDEDLIKWHNQLWKTNI